MTSAGRIRPTGLAAVTGVLGLLALVTPLGGAEYPASRIGALLAFAAAVEVLHSFRRSTPSSRGTGTAGGMISMAIALFLINAPFLAAQALRVVIAGWFSIDAVRCIVAVVRSRESRERSTAALGVIGNLVVVLLILLARGWLLTLGRRDRRRAAHLRHHVEHPRRAGLHERGER